MPRPPVMVALALVLTAAAARAEGKDPAAAEALFREGRRAADAGDYAKACPKFEESYRLDPAPGTLLNLGDCEENRGQLARAWEHFERLHDELPSSDRRKRIAEARARALEPRLPKLRIVVLASIPAVVTRDDVALGAASLGATLPVDPGRHVVVVSAAGRRDRRYELSLSAGDDTELWVSPGDPLPRAPSSGGAASETSASRRRERSSDHQGSGRRTAAILLGGLGVAALVPGALLAGFSVNEMSGRPSSDQLRQAQAYEIGGVVTIGVGAVLLGTALLMVLTSPHPSGRAALAPSGVIRF